MAEEQESTSRKSFSGTQVMLFVLGTILVTTAFSFWVFRTYIQPVDFKPVELSAKEQVKLDSKLQQLGVNPRELLPNAKRQDKFDNEGRLVPEKYSEEGATRDIRMTERELNALVASNPDMARRFAIDLSSELASAKLLIPIDPDMPMLGGKTLRVNAGVELGYHDGRPRVMLRGVSVMGVPVPNAWLGNLKNVDLVKEFGSGPGFWNSFAAGVDLVEIKDGELHIKLKE